MKRLLLILITILFAACSKPDEPCECLGKFLSVKSERYFFIQVDCDKYHIGSNGVSDDSLPQDFIFLGCN